MTHCQIIPHMYIKIYNIYTVNLDHLRVVFFASFIALAYTIKALLFRHSLYFSCARNEGCIIARRKSVEWTYRWEIFARIDWIHVIHRIASPTFRCFRIRISQSVPIGFYLQRGRLLCHCNSSRYLSLAARKAIRRERERGCPINKINRVSSCGCIHVHCGTHCKRIASASRWAIFTILWTRAALLCQREERENLLSSSSLAPPKVLVSSIRTLSYISSRLDTRARANNTRSNLQIFARVAYRARWCSSFKYRRAYSNKAPRGFSDGNA